jgi:hypothetical protein
MEMGEPFAQLDLALLEGHLLLEPRNLCVVNARGLGHFFFSAGITSTKGRF